MKLGSKSRNLVEIIAGVLLVGSIATSLLQMTEFFNLTIILLSILLLFWCSKNNATVEQASAVRLWAISLFVFSVIWGVSISNTADSELADYEKPLKFIVCILIALQFTKLRISIKFLYWGAVLCLMLTSIDVLDQSYHRLELGMNAGTAGYQLSIILLMVVSYMIFESNVRAWEYAGGIFSVVLGFWLVLETQTRGALIVIAIYFIIVAFEKIREAQTSHRIVTVLLALAMLGALSWMIASTDVFKSRINSAIVDLQMIEQGNLQGSIGRRVALLQVGLHAIKTPTLLGKGENSSENLKGYIAEMEDGNKYLFVLQNLHFHNQYLDQFTKRGVIGLLVYVVFLFGPLFLANRKKRQALYSVVLPLGVGGLIETPFNNSNFITSYLLYVTFILVVCHNKMIEVEEITEARGLE